MLIVVVHYWTRERDGLILSRRRFIYIFVRGSGGGGGAC